MRWSPGPALACSAPVNQARLVPLGLGTILPASQMVRSTALLLAKGPGRPVDSPEEGQRALLSDPAGHQSQIRGQPYAPRLRLYIKWHRKHAHATLHTQVAEPRDTCRGAPASPRARRQVTGPTREQPGALGVWGDRRPRLAAGETQTPRPRVCTGEGSRPPHTSPGNQMLHRLRLRSST